MPIFQLLPGLKPETTPCCSFLNLLWNLFLSLAEVIFH